MRKPRAKMLNENLAECCVIFGMFDEARPGGPKGPKRFFGQRFPFQLKEETPVLAGAYYRPEPMVLARGPRSGDP